MKGYQKKFTTTKQTTTTATHTHTFKNKLNNMMTYTKS